MEEIFTSCNCAKACPNCLQHFGNQRVKEQLDRFLGLDLLLFLRDGQLKTDISFDEKCQYVDELNEIANLHGMDNIITNENKAFYLKTLSGNKEIIFYPAMCNIETQGTNEQIFLPDRLCRYAMSEIWKKIQDRI